jgi:hypothetical protein
MRILAYGQPCAGPLSVETALVMTAARLTPQELSRILAAVESHLLDAGVDAGQARDFVVSFGRDVLARQP